MNTSIPPVPKKQRKNSPLCLIDGHKMCVKGAFRHDTCECDCHYVVNYSWFGQSTKDLLNDLGYSLWSAKRSGRDIGSIDEFTTSVLIAETLQKSGKFVTTSTADAVLVAEELSTALQPCLHRDYWSQMEMLDDLQPVLEKHAILA